MAAPAPSSSQEQKSEKQKMLAGELYCAWDPELIKEREAARALVREFNATQENELERRRVILKKLFAFVGENVFIEPPLRCDYGTNIRIGKNSFVNFNATFLDTCAIEIGDYTLLGPNVQLYSASHPTDPTTRLSGKEDGKPIKIGNNCWIGGGAILLPGVTIGDNSTIGAGSVVTKNIPANVVAAGNPCKVIRSVQPPAPDAPVYFLPS